MTNDLRARSLTLTFVTYSLVHILQKEKITAEFAAKVPSVNGYGRDISLRSILRIENFNSTLLMGNMN